MDDRLDSKVAFVVGGTSGIGEGSARAMADAGASVAVAGRTRGSGEAVAESIRDSGGEAIYVECDLTDQESVDDAIAVAVDRNGGIDVGFNSAGAMARGPVTETDEADLQRVVDVNLQGAVRFAKAAIPELVETGGTLVTVSSEAAERGVENLSVYCASKGGVNALTRQLAVEYGPEGVNVNAISPGLTKTPINEEVRREDPDWVENRRADIPIGLLNEPEDIGELGVYLASDAAKTVNGAIVNIDGGTTAR